MVIFNVGIKILIWIVAVFFVIFYYLCYLWSEMHEKRERIFIAFMVSFLYSVKIFLIGFGLIFLVALIFEYLKTLPKPL